MWLVGRAEQAPPGVSTTTSVRPVEDVCVARPPLDVGDVGRKHVALAHSRSRLNDFAVRVDETELGRQLHDLIMTQGDGDVAAFLVGELCLDVADHFDGPRGEVAGSVGELAHPFLPIFEGRRPVRE